MKNYFLILSVLLCAVVHAQYPAVGIADVSPASSSTPACMSDIMRQKIQLSYNDGLHSEQHMNERIFEHVQGRAGGILYVPVVVHIVHNNGAENISDQTVLQGIQDLNDAFANTGPYHTPSGFDMGIRFCLAQQDPNGLPTSGITRHVSTLTEVVGDNGQDLQLKDIVRWDPTQYVNIWLVREITSQSMGPSVAGYAHMPNAHGTPEDGIVNEARWFGNNTNDSKIHIHEMGHYLGLYHTFEGGCTNNNCLTDGDRVCDTPPDGSSAPTPCSSFSNTCSTDDDDLSANNPFRPVNLGGLGDQDDPMEDYMDYGDKACQKSFTDGQGERMRDALQTIRASLLESQACQTSCGIGIVGIDTSQVLTVTAGQAIQLQSHYTATVPVTFKWVFNGQTISTQETLSFTFSNAQIGTHYLYMHWMNLAGNCELVDSILLHVKCNPPAAFGFTPYIIEPGVPVTFNGSHPMATSYKWFLNGQQVSTAPSFTYTFPSGGANHMYLVTGNGQCFDTSAVEYLGVGSCGSGENNHWVVGRGSGSLIDFSSGSPIVTAIEDNGNNQLGTIEGMATMSDRNGNLLFYSDGTRLFNRNHEVFFTQMGAGSSSAQGVLILPDPGNAQSYYVFTAENFGGISYPTLRGLAYLKVDMTMNGGLGGVSSSYNTLLYQTSEKLTATKHCNGTDMWVVAHGFNDNKFYSYLITAAGVQAPVISTVGNSQYQASNAVGSQGIGVHKISPDGTKLLSSNSTLGFAELFDFDNSTGIISNQFLFPPGTFMYSGEFSPDGSKIYYVEDDDKKIYCIDISSGSTQIMYLSVTAVGTSSASNYLGTVSMGPDGKLYIARTDNFIDAINHPNAPPANCGFQTEAIYLPTGGFYGLNNIYISSKTPGPQIIGPTQVCVGQNNVKYKVGCGQNTWEYRGQNGYTVLSQKEISVNFTTVSVDTLICHRANTCIGAASDTVIIHVGGNNMANLGPNVSICSGSSVTLNPGSGFYQVQWSTNVYTPTLTVSQPGTYWVQVTALGGCTDRDTIVVSSFGGNFNVPDEPTIQICSTTSQLPYVLHAAQGNFTHVWNNTQTSNDSITVYPTTPITRVPITYYNAQGCADKDTFVIQMVNSFPPIHIGNDTTVCPGQLVILHRNSNYPYINYEWSDGSSGPTFTVYQAGTYWLTYEDPICHYQHTDEVVVSNHPQPQSNLPDVPLTLCPNNTIQLDAGGGYPVLWHDGSTNRYHSANQEGIYWAELQGICGAVRDSVTINFLPASSYNFGFADTVTLCSNSLPYSLSGNNTLPMSNYQWSTGDQTVNILVTQEGTYSVTANSYCGLVGDTTYVRILQQPANILPPTALLCNGQSTYVLHGAPNAVNTWSTGAVADSIIVTQTGTYQISSVGANGCVTEDLIFVSFSNMYLQEVNDTTICPGQTLSIYPNTNASALFGPGGPLTPPLIISDTGNYSIYAIDGGCVAFTSFHVGFTVEGNFEIHLADSIHACSDELPITLSAGNQFSQYEWNTGATTSSISVSNGGWYSVEASYGCVQGHDSTFVSISPSFTVSLPADTSLCPGQSLILSANPQYSNLWSTGSTATQISVDTEGSYWLQSNNGGCVRSDTVHVETSDLFLLPIDDESFCAKQTVAMEAITNGSIVWITGQTVSTVTYNQPGNYSVTATLGDCQLTETFTLTQLPSPSFSLGADIAVANGPVTIGIPNTFASYHWSPGGQSTSTISANSPGTYILTATNASGCSSSDTIKVYFTAGISGNSENETYLYIPQIISPSHGPLMAQYHGIQLTSVTVYDATGKLISGTRNEFPTVWDGTSGTGSTAATGMYYYSLHYVTDAGKVGVYHGKVLLIE